MARRNKNTDTPAEITPEAVPTEATEEAPEMITEEYRDETVALDETPAVEVTAEATEAPAEVTPEATDESKSGEVDLTEYKSAVANALAERDSATGQVPVVQVESVKAAYRNLDGLKAKNAAKKELTESLKDAVNSMDIVLGKAIMILSESLATAGSNAKAAAERTPVDKAEAYVQRLVALNLAYNMASEDIPEGVDVDAAREKAEQQVNALEADAAKYYRYVQAPADERGDEPEADALVKKAVKLALGKGVSVKSTGVAHEGPRGNIAKHIQEAFAEQPDGTFLKVAEIAKFRSTEYPDGNASPGAVTARLFPGEGKKTTVEGIEPGVNDQSKRGAYKLAA